MLLGCSNEPRPETSVKQFNVKLDDMNCVIYHTSYDYQYYTRIIRCIDKDGKSTIFGSR